MKILKNKYAVALLIASIVVMVWQAFRIQQANQAATLLGMTDYDYSTDSTDRYDATNWDGYQTGTGVPPWSN